MSAPATVGAGAILREPNTFSAQDLAKDLFANVPLDDCWAEKDMRTFSPLMAISREGTCAFELPALDSEMYLFSDLILEVRVRLEDSEGKLPESRAAVGPVNNLLHSIIKECKIKINGSDGK